MNTEGAMNGARRMGCDHITGCLIGERARSSHARRIDVLTAALAASNVRGYVGRLPADPGVLETSRTRPNTQLVTLAPDEAQRLERAPSAKLRDGRADRRHPSGMGAVHRFPKSRSRSGRTGVWEKATLRTRRPENWNHRPGGRSPMQVELADRAKHRSVLGVAWVEPSR
jgi:hypothetical protein